MDRIGALERLSRLRAEGVLTDAQFEEAKRTWIDNIAPAPHAGIADGGSGVRWIWLALVGICALAAVMGATIFWHGKAAGDAAAKSAAGVVVPTSTRPPQYQLRSNVAGASLVRLTELPSVTPYGDDRDGYCPGSITPRTPGGKRATARGWRVIQETKFAGFDVVLIVRGWDPGTSSRCAAKDGNVAFFAGEQLVGILFSKGEDGVRINRLEAVGDHLRLWSQDPAAEGQFAMHGSALTFDRITGSDLVCGGKYAVPAVFGMRYPEARKQLTAAGWLPRPSSEDAGDDAVLLELRQRFPEADACAGTGYGECRFALAARDGVAKLVITTIGGPDDAGVAIYHALCDGKHSDRPSRGGYYF